MLLTIGLIIGLVCGGIAGFLLHRATSRINEGAVETIAAKIASKQTDQLLRLAEEKLSDKKEAIEGSLKVMKADMKSELVRVEEVMKAIGTSNTKVDTRLEHAAKTIKELSETTSNLKNALSSNSGRGQWGERMAEDVLRIAGFTEGISYTKQRKLEAAGSKPDFTFLLPQNLKVNMDVKFPFNNYQAFLSATNESDKEAAKKKFLKDVKERIREIQTRDYINPDDNTVDYVLLFVPNEQVFAFINEMDRTLVDEAIKARTILCSPLSLYAVLALIRQSIDNFNLEKKSLEMLSLFGSFKQQWMRFKEEIKTVGKRLESTRTAFEEMAGPRQRQLEKPLLRIEEIREEKNIEPAALRSEKIVIDAAENMMQKLL